MLFEWRRRGEGTVGKFTENGAINGADSGRIGRGHAVLLDGKGRALR